MGWKTLTNLFRSKEAIEANELLHNVVETYRDVIEFAKKHEGPEIRRNEDVFSQKASIGWLNSCLVSNVTNYVELPSGMDHIKFRRLKNSKESSIQDDEAPSTSALDGYDPKQLMRFDVCSSVLDEDFEISYPRTTGLWAGTSHYDRYTKRSINGLSVFVDRAKKEVVETRPYVCAKIEERRVDSSEMFP